MREEEEETNWFDRWENDLPKPEELMPFSQSLITSALALAFDIPIQNPNPISPGNQQIPPDFEDDATRTPKRPRMVWTPQLHRRFVDAVARLGIKNAVPKTIMRLMGVDGLTRENVASHLQKYRLYLKRMQALSSSSQQLVSGKSISLPLLSPGQDSFLMNHHHQRHMPHSGFHARGSSPPTEFFGIGASGLGLVASNSCDYVDDDDDDVEGGGRRVLTLFPASGED